MPIRSQSLLVEDGAYPCKFGELTLDDNTVSLRSCGKAAITMTPAVRIEQKWLSPPSHACSASLTRITCNLPGYGHLAVDLSGQAVRLSFEAARPVIIEALALNGSFYLPGARGWLSNGFHSWSQTGVISLKAPPSPKALDKALRLTGEDEVYRRGEELSWWYTFIGGGKQSFVAGVSSASRLGSWITASRKEATDWIEFKLVSGGVERIKLEANEALQGEIWQLLLGDDMQSLLRYYGQTIESRRVTKPMPVPVGWNSWYDLWDDVKQDDILSNADRMTEIFLPRIPLSHQEVHIVVDDGWQEAWGDWLPNKKFPLGVDGLAHSLKNKGYATGLWLAPLLVSPRSKLASNHPDWLVKGANYHHPVNGNFYILDVTHPEAAAHLVATVKTIVSWGVSLLKIDFLFGGALEGKRFRNVTGMEAYHLAMSLIRRASGDDIMLIAVGAPPIPSFPYVDGWRVGGDIAFKPAIFGLPRPSFAFIANQARSIAGRQPFCLITLCDGDPALLRTLSKEQVDTGAWVAVLTGGALFLSDDLNRLAADRLAFGFSEEKIAQGLSGEPARLESYFPRKIPTSLVNMKDRFFTAEHDVPSIWILPDGRRVAINFTASDEIIAGVKVPKHTSRILEE